jgi:predicted transport protein
MLDLVSATATTKLVSSGEPGASTTYKSIGEVLSGLDTALMDRFEALRAYIKALGDDVQETVLRLYIGFKRIKNFACVEFLPSDGRILVYVKVDPTKIELEPGFTRDVTKLGHYGTGDLEITLSKSEDPERAKPLIQLSYEAS